MRSTPSTVSVVIPNYNYARTLPLCIDALRRQTRQPLEVLMVDDCSTDDSVAIAEALGVQVIPSPTNRGVAAARNLGAAHARGDVIMFVDSDVALAPDAVEQLVALLDADPTLGSVCGIYDPVPLIRDSAVEEYRSLQAHYWRASSEGDVSFGFFSLGAIRKDVFDDIGPFNESLKQTEEVDYGQRLTRKYRIWLSASVRGRHDDDHELGSMLRKLYHRGRLRVPLYARRRRFATGFETSSRAFATMAATLMVLTSPLPLVLGALWAVVPVGLMAVFIGLDAGQYRFVTRQKGFAFLVFFLAVHLLVNLAIMAGILSGLAQWAASLRFRRLYDDVPKTAPRPAVA